MKTSRKMVFCLFVIVSIISLASFSSLASETETEDMFNYAEALQKSLYFYDANKCGYGISGARLEWRGDCHIADAKRPYDAFVNLSESVILDNIEAFDPNGDGFIDVSGGFHDAGDHIKFGLPQSFTASTLGWGYYEFKEAYQEIGEEEHILDILKRFNDYFLRCTFRDENGDVIAFAYMVGEGTEDHSYWGPPELQAVTEYDVRTVYCASEENPASDQASGAAASLAINYLNFKDIDQEYAEESLDTAIALYEFAREHRGLGDDNGFYNSSYDYDEMSWAAVWLYAATGDMEYIDHITATEDGKYTGYMQRIIKSTENSWQNIWVHSWDTVWGGVFTKLASLFPDDEQLDYLARWNLEYWTGGDVPHEDPTDTTFLEPTPAGYAMLNTWGSARYNTAAQLCILVYQKYNPDRTDLTDWARGQMEYIMGDNPMEYAYIVGYGDASAENPHHRASHGSKSNSMDEPEVQRHTLWGALVGGPDSDDYHEDKTSDFIYNEVAIDYNAGFVGALAGHYLLYGEGDEPIENFPPKEPEIEEFFTNALVEQENDERSQITITLHNESAKPPRLEDGMSIRYFFDISELVEGGQTIDDVTFEVYYDQSGFANDNAVQTRGPIKWNDDNVYFVEVAWSGYQIYGEMEVQIALMVGQNDNWESNWDPTNDWSREGLSGENSKNNRIPVYIDHELVFGEEPPAEGVIPEAPVLEVESYEDSGTVDLYWDEVENASGYRLTWGANEGYPAEVLIDLGSETSYTIDNLTMDRAYNFKVDSYNDYGVSNFSNEELVTFGNEIDEDPEVMPGDIDGDSMISSLDISLLVRYVIGRIDEFSSEEAEIAADLNEDSMINSMDYAVLRRVILGSLEL